jgi:gluconokinase
VKPQLEPFTIGLDLGTTGCKAVAVASNGTVLGVTGGKYPLEQAEAGQATQNPVLVLEAACEALQQLCAELNAPPLALGLSGAMHSLLAVDARGHPLASALTWADARPGTKLEKLRSQIDPLDVYALTGCPLQAPFFPAKLEWLRQSQPNVFSRAARFISITEFVSEALTGTRGSSLGIASATGLLNLETQTWDETLLELCGLSQDQFSPVFDADAVIGTVTPSAAERTGLPLGLPVISGSSDGPCANLGAGAMPGQTVITVGTSGAVRQILDMPQLDPLARTFCYRVSSTQLLAGGAINNAGLLIEWLGSNLYVDVARAERFERLFADADSVAPGADGLTVLPYLTGERSPHWRSDLNFSVHVASLHHSRAHIARATLEAIAFCLADIAKIIGLDRSRPVKLTGGFTKSRVWTQLLADVLQLSLEPVELADASALGAARLAWLHLEPGLENPQPEAGLIVSPNAPQDAFEQAHARFHATFEREYPINPRR